MNRLRPRLTWVVFVACLGVVCAAMVWMSATALRLERAEFQAQQQSESERLALWRMDSALVPLVTRESSRPHRVYSAFYQAEHAYSKWLTKVQRGEIQVPSPLLTYESPYIRLHFQFDPAGRLTSPQVPTSSRRDLAEVNYASHEKIEAAEKLLSDLRNRLTRKQLLRKLAIEEVVPESVPGQGAPNESAIAQQQFEASPQYAGPFAQQGGASRIRRNAAEFQKRAQTANNSLVEPPKYGMTVKERVDIRPMKAVWVDDLLLLARETRVDGKQYVQGCALHWPAVRDWMKAEIADLLPDGELLPRKSPRDGNSQLMLASIPVRLSPGNAVAELPTGWTPIQLSLVIAWFCIVLAAVAVAALLLATIRLSERRGTFVSAVTHELRTPLTTFRMYTDMLASGMVTEQAQRHQYLETLRHEADRLGHLVENVLSYARLDSSRKRLVRENVCLNDVLMRTQDSLRSHVEKAGMTLELAIPPEPLQVVHADASAIERILVNLVDNACKYAAGADDKRVHVECTAEAGSVSLHVRDYGPGLSDSEKKRMFQPFSKSDSDAANSAPGVGLGLSLCRQLARSMGGELRLDDGDAAGAQFVLRLPRADSSQTG